MYRGDHCREKNYISRRTPRKSPTEPDSGRDREEGRRGVKERKGRERRAGQDRQEGTIIGCRAAAEQKGTEREKKRVEVNFGSASCIGRLLHLSQRDNDGFPHSFRLPRHMSADRIVDYPI